MLTQSAGDAAFSLFNPNPRSKNPFGKIDCVVRAICAAFGLTWEQAYTALSIQGFADGDNWASDDVWGNLLEGRGWAWFRIPDTCPRCYTLADFARDYPEGVYIIGTGSHAVCVRDGTVYDAWDSRRVVPLFAWRMPD